jgi:hypothetical protein
MLACGSARLPSPALGSKSNQLTTRKELSMKRRNLLIGIAVLVAIPVAYYLLSPLFFDVEVSEGFPTPAPGENVFDNPEIAPTATKMMEEAMAEDPIEMAEPMPEGDMAEMEILVQGAFYDIAHEGMGTATIYRLADGTRVLRFENFEVLNGPELHVYLAPQDPVADTVGVELEGAIDLGQLKGNIGDQNYTLPDDLDLSQFSSVVIWCVPFRVPFNAAGLAAP